MQREHLLAALASLGVIVALLTDVQGPGLLAKGGPQATAAAILAGAIAFGGLEAVRVLNRRIG